jgi:prevent-host-death family protein
MKATWQIQTAKAQLSEVVARCTQDGPQTITKHGRPVAHLISHQDYELMARPLRKVDISAKERRLKKIFGNRKMKGNPVLESRR